MNSESSKDRISKVCILEKDGALPSDWIPCVVGRDIKFQHDVLRSYCFAGWDPIIYDLMLVSAAVHFCDWSFKRPTGTWSRSFELRIPVHDPRRWNDGQVHTLLHQALRLLTLDRWSIAFVPRSHPVEPPKQQSLALSTRTEAAVAFSNGLDSYCVSGWFAAECGSDALVRVRVGRRNKDQPRHEPFTAIPFHVQPFGNNHETSGRARGFRFAAAGGLAAALLNISDIVMPESGSGALGPVLLRYAGMYSDFRNHPKFFRHMEAFLGALLNRQLNFKQPRLEQTKGESVLKYLDHPNVDRSPAVEALIKTRSCWQSRHNVSIDNHKRQCGVCASCMLRRLSMHVAGIEEPEGTYSWEDLNAPDLITAAPQKYKNRVGPMLQKYAMAGTLHFTHLARLRSSFDYPAISNHHSRELAEATGADQASVKVWLDNFLQRHEAQWRSFLAPLETGSFVKQWARMS